MDVSQHGEAGLLINYFAANAPKHKVLVDVGAFGIPRSNTFNLLKDHGWSGLLIEPMPRDEYFGPLVEAFKHTPTVSFLEGVAIGDYDGMGTAFDNQIAGHRSLLNEEENDGLISVRVKPLSKVLDKFKIPLDFGLLSVDAEGFDQRIIEHLMLHSLYRPKVIVLEKDGNRPLWLDLEPRGYQLIFETEGNLAYGSK